MISGKNIINLFRCLTIDNIIELFKLAMLEQKIIVISKYPALLNQVITVILGLLFPFSWENAGIIPILPQHLYVYTDALFPFIFGIIATEENDFGHKFINKLDINIVFLDDNKIRYSKGSPKFNCSEFRELQNDLSAFKNIYKNQHNQIKI